MEKTGALRPRPSIQLHQMPEEYRLHPRSCTCYPGCACLSPFPFERCCLLLAFASLVSRTTPLSSLSLSTSPHPPRVTHDGRSPHAHAYASTCFPRSRVSRCTRAHARTPSSLCVHGLVCAHRRVAISAALVVFISDWPVQRFQPATPTSLAHPSTWGCSALWPSSLPSRFASLSCVCIRVCVPSCALTRPHPLIHLFSHGSSAFHLVQSVAFWPPRPAVCRRCSWPSLQHDTSPLGALILLG